MAFLSAYPLALSLEETIPSPGCRGASSKWHQFTTIDAFFVNVNKSSFPEIVPEQSESASFVTLVEIHNVDVPVASSRDATLQWPSAIAVNSSLIRALIHLHNQHVGPTIGSSFLVPQLKRQANHERLVCVQCSKFIVFCPILAIANQY